MAVEEFVGRKRELAILRSELGEVKAAAGSSRPGRCLILRGRRRVGKSRLVEVFVERARLPYLYYEASGRRIDEELAQFAEEVRQSNIPRRDVFLDTSLATWDAAFRQLAAALPDDKPSIVVLDEIPYLMAADPGFEGTLQRCWDRYLERKPTLLLLIGSDLAMMRVLGEYGRPFYQRGKEMVLPPLNPAEVGHLLNVPPTEAFDSFLITGGLPLICREWRAGESQWHYLARALSSPISALLVSGERALAAEFPAEGLARTVLTAVGSGERTMANISHAVGVPNASVKRALDLLINKGIVIAERPLSTRPSRETRYRVTDSYQRFWLRFIDTHIGDVERGRGDRVLRRIRESWATWRGRAIEPVVREALSRLVPDGQLPEAQALGGYWTRSNSVEVDIVGADRAEIAKKVVFVGSIKWLENDAFDVRDLRRLVVHRANVPGADDETPLVAVSRAGVTCDGLDATYGPEQLLAAWPR